MTLQLSSICTFTFSPRKLKDFHERSQIFRLRNATNLNIERSFQFSVVFLLGQPSLTVKQERFGNVRVQHFHPIEKPIRRKIGVIVTYFHLEQLSKVNRFQTESVSLYSKTSFSNVDTESCSNIVILSQFLAINRS